MFPRHSEGKGQYGEELERGENSNTHLPLAVHFISAHMYKALHCPQLMGALQQDMSPHDVVLSEAEAVSKAIINMSLSCKVKNLIHKGVRRMSREFKAGASGRVGRTVSISSSRSAYVTRSLEQIFPLINYRRHALKVVSRPVISHTYWNKSHSFSLCNS